MLRILCLIDHSQLFTNVPTFKSFLMALRLYEANLLARFTIVWALRH